MIYLIAAIVLIFASNAVALLIVAGSDVTRYVDIVALCGLLGATPEQCSAAAADAGRIGCLAAAIVLVLLILTNRRFPGGSDAARFGAEAFSAFAPLVVLVVGFQLWVELKSPWPIYQYEVYHAEIAGGSAALSLGNFVWPLCLQFANSATTIKWRILFFSLLAPILAESPFRGAMLAVAVFGIAAPGIEQAVAHVRSQGLRSRQALLYGSIVIVALLALALQLAIETRDRPTDLKATGGAISQLTAKLGQRVAMPLYQAQLAQAHGIDQQVPSIADDVLTKLRLRSATTVNSYFYKLLHYQIAFGETTILYFGEAALRTTAPPLIWCVVAPFILVLVWVVMRRYGYATGTVVGIAMWRGSLGGFVEIAPTLALQILLVAALSVFCKTESSHGR